MRRTTRLDWLRQQLAKRDQQNLVFLQHGSHELKTPLTAIHEGIALLQDHAGPNFLQLSSIFGLDNVGHSWRLFNILDLFAHLLDQHFHFH